MPLLEWLVQKVVSIFRTEPYVWEGQAKLIVVSLFNAVFYLVFFHYDFMSPLVAAATDVSMAWWQGVALSTILVAGGSNLIHQVFNK